MKKTLYHPSWNPVIKPEFKKPYFNKLKLILLDEKNKENLIFPDPRLIFNAFKICPLNKVKVVIIGQDPYHGQGQAHGLSFSVPKGVPKPPSLKNILKELHNDLNVPVPLHGCLEEWAKQGVLLLNTSLTVVAHKPISHSNIGWGKFTDRIIKEVSSKKTGLVFLLWGKQAQNKKSLINSDKHCILEAPHPSPLSAHKGFFGCRHFSETNKLLHVLGKSPIDWKL